MHGMAGVDEDAGRHAADIIKEAQQRQVPVVTLREAARRTGISPEGWAKVIKTGRGRQETFVAMARVVGVEAEVRQALGLPEVAAPPAADLTTATGDAVVITLSAALSIFERTIMESGLPAQVKLDLIRMHRNTGADELLDRLSQQERKRTNG